MADATRTQRFAAVCWHVASYSGQCEETLSGIHATGQIRELCRRWIVGLRLYVHAKMDEVSVRTKERVMGRRRVILRLVAHTNTQRTNKGMCRVTQNHHDVGHCRPYPAKFRVVPNAYHVEGNSIAAQKVAGSTTKLAPPPLSPTTADPGRIKSFVYSPSPEPAIIQFSFAWIHDHRPSRKYV